MQGSFESFVTNFVHSSFKAFLATIFLKTGEIHTGFERELESSSLDATALKYELLEARKVLVVRLNQLSVLKTSFFSGLSRLSYSLFSFSSTIDSYGSVEVQRCRNFTALSFISSFLLTTFKDTAGAMNFNNSWNLVQLKKGKCMYTSR